jgi:hypothetical protein
MDCSDFRRLTGRMLDGAVNRKEAEELGLHVASCEDCREAFARLEGLTNLHAGLPEIGLPGRLTDRIMDRVAELDVERTGWLWKILVPAAAAVFVLLGIQIGTQITDSLLPESEVNHAEVTGLEYLDDHPPDSFGRIMGLAARGGEDE